MSDMYVPYLLRDDRSQATSYLFMYENVAAGRRPSDEPKDNGVCMKFPRESTCSLEDINRPRLNVSEEFDSIEEFFDVFEDSRRITCNIDRKDYSKALKFFT